MYLVVKYDCFGNRYCKHNLFNYILYIFYVDILASQCLLYFLFPFLISFWLYIFIKIINFINCIL